ASTNVVMLRGVTPSSSPRSLIFCGPWQLKVPNSRKRDHEMPSTGWHRCSQRSKAWVNRPVASTSCNGRSPEDSCRGSVPVNLVCIHDPVVQCVHDDIVPALLQQYTATGAVAARSRLAHRGQKLARAALPTLGRSCSDEPAFD